MGLVIAMKHIGRKTISFWAIRALIFIISLFILRLLLEAFRPQIEGFISNSITDDSVDGKVFDILFGLSELLLSAILTPFVESKFLPKNTPEVLITSPRDCKKNITGIKNSPIRSHTPCIKIGTENRQYRVVYMKIKNTGQLVISNFSINGQATNLALETETNEELSIIIFEPVSGQKRTRKYKLSVCVQDVQSSIYTQSYHMIINESLSKAMFKPCSKMKRRRLKNVL